MMAGMLSSGAWANDVYVDQIGDNTSVSITQTGAGNTVNGNVGGNGNVDDAKACLLRRRPVVIGLLHRGPVTRPSGGGHYIILTGFDTRGWLVHDPYGEIDLVAGGWVRTGNGSGRSQHYSFRNTNPRWLVEGPRSGWGWTRTPPRGSLAGLAWRRMKGAGGKVSDLGTPPHRRSLSWSRATPCLADQCCEPARNPGLDAAAV